MLGIVISRTLLGGVRHIPGDLARVKARYEGFLSK